MLITKTSRLRRSPPLALEGRRAGLLEAASEDEIVEAAAWARERGATLFVLGGGQQSAGLRRWV